MCIHVLFIWYLKIPTLGLGNDRLSLLVSALNEEVDTWTWKWDAWILWVSETLCASKKGRWGEGELVTDQFIKDIKQVMTWSCTKNLIDWKMSSLITAAFIWQQNHKNFSYIPSNIGKRKLSHIHNLHYNISFNCISVKSCNALAITNNKFKDIIGTYNKVPKTNSDRSYWSYVHSIYLCGKK